ncbi:MAG TPA: DUF6401 family natural product biosynthesis protein [Amycolatopsis sp.]|nr:DUF6401 family natural product biosynthesis protein [Amycolatopsis sp.]
MGWADNLADRSARRWLQGAAGRLESGWLALADDFALWTAYERHLVAAVDAIRCEAELVPRTEPVTDLVLLAGHAHDVWANAVAREWQPPQSAADWDPREWTGLRILACYRLAALEPGGPRLTRAAADPPLPRAAADLLSRIPKRVR